MGHILTVLVELAPLSLIDGGLPVVIPFVVNIVTAAQ